MTCIVVAAAVELSERGYIVRPAEASDLARLVQLEELCWQHTHFAAAASGRACSDIPMASSYWWRILARSWAPFTASVLGMSPPWRAEVPRMFMSCTTRRARSLNGWH